MVVSYLTLEGGQYLALVKESVRALALRELGLSPWLGDVIQLLSDKGWLDVDACEKHGVLEHEGKRCGDDVPESFLVLVLMERVPYALTLGRSLDCLKGIELRFGPSVYAKVRLVEPVKQELPLVEVDLDVVTLAAQEEGVAVSADTVVGVVDEVLCEKGVNGLGGCEPSAVQEVLEEGVDGYCYLEMFHESMRAEISHVLGREPLVRHLLLYYLVALRRGFAVDQCGFVLHTKHMLHVVADRDGGVIRMLDQLVLHAKQEEMRVGGSSAWRGCEKLGDGNLCVGLCEMCEGKSLMEHRQGSARQCCCRDHRIGELVSPRGVVESGTSIVAVRGDLCPVRLSQSFMEEFGVDVGVEMCSDSGDETTLVNDDGGVRVPLVPGGGFPCCYAGLARGSYELSLHEGMLSLDVVAARVVIPPGRAWAFRSSGLEMESDSVTVVLVFGVAQLDMKGLVGRLKVHVGNFEELVRWSHKYLGEDPRESFSRFWTRTGQSVVVGRFGLSAKHESEAVSAVGSELLQYDVEGGSQVSSDGLSRVVYRGAARVFRVVQCGAAVIVVDGTAMVQGSALVDKGLLIKITPSPEITAGVGFVRRIPLFAVAAEQPAGRMSLRLLEGVDEYALDDGGPSDEEGYPPEY